MKIFSFNLIWISSGLIFFICDRVLKRLFYKQTIPDSLFFSYAQNKGIAFGINFPAALNIFFYIIIIFILFALVCALIYYMRHKIIHGALATWIILLGSASNLIDRINFGFVIDYIDLYFWPVFNIGDMMIVSGTIVLALLYLKVEL